MRDRAAAAQLFLDHLTLIEQVLDGVCRSCHFSLEDTDEYKSRAKLHVIEDDYRILRCFEGRASLACYLRVVFQRLALDYRDDILGKWRASAPAKRQGAAAMLLDKWLHREKLPRQEAVRRVAEETGESLEVLEALAATLPANLGRPRNAGAEPLEKLVSPSSESPIEQREREAVHDRVKGALQAAMAALSDEDKLLLKLFYVKELSAKRLAAWFGYANERIIYRRLDALRDRLKSHLLEGGVMAAQVAELIGWKNFDAELDWGED